MTNISKIVATKFVDGKKQPCDDELVEFKKVLGEARTLPPHFVRDIIMKAPTGDIMKSMCIELISTFPLFASYA